MANFSQRKSRMDKKKLQDQLKRIKANTLSEKRAKAGIDPSDKLFQDILLKKITILKSQKNDSMNFSRGTLRGL